MPTLLRLPQDALALWERLPRTQKLVLAFIGALAVGLFAYNFASSQSKPMATLYSSLEAEDAGAITAELDSLGISHELSAGGTAIQVPADKVDEARIELAQLGLPQGGAVGFEIFDRTNFGITDFAQRVNFQRGLEGELARTIRQMAAVDGARVHIVLPERQVFADAQQPTTASVVLDLKPGRSLEEGQIRGIAHLVSHSIEGLSDENLTIIDTSGTMLFDGSDASLASGAMSGTQMQMQRAFEQGLQNDVLRMLQQALGPNKAAVQIRAQINFDQVEESSETFAPATDGSGIPRSSSEVSETFQGTSAAAGGVPGVAANVPGAAVATGAGGTGDSQYDRTETTTNFELNRTTQTTVRAPGNIEKLSVAVLIDESIAPEQVTALTESISAAVGLDAARGDQLVVTRLPFDTTAIEEAQQTIDTAGSSDAMFMYLRLATPVLAIILALFFFWFLRRSLNRGRQGWVYDPSIQVLAPAALSGGGATEAALAQMMAPQQDRPVAYIEPPAPEEVKRREAVNQRVSALARTQPEAVAEVLQSWLKEE